MTTMKIDAPPKISRWMNRLSRSWGGFGVQVILWVLVMITLMPMWLIVSASLTEEVSLTQDGFGLWPKVFSLDSYSLVLNDSGQVVQAYGVTILVTVIGTVLSLALMATLAYPLSRPDYRLRRPISFIVLFTLLFSGGIVPLYILLTQALQLRNTIAVLILPNLIRVFYVLILRTYFAETPQEILDAARVDGANEWDVFVSIAIPLAKPALATVGLFVALDFWNDWATALYFISDSKLYPLQYLLYQIMANARELALEPNMIGLQAMPLQSTRMAMAVLATGPAALAFLFFQKYLERGITLGALK